MMNSNRFARRSLLGVALLAGLCTTTAGCSIFSQLQYMLYGLKVEPKFTGMEKKRVAIVCVSSSAVGPSNEASSIAKSIGTTLAFNLKETTIINQGEVANWMDKNDWDEIDYPVVGRGVKADLVIGVDLTSFSLHEGQTLLRGRAEVTVRVFDMKKNGAVVYGPTSKSIVFPEHGARHITENESNFRRVFIYTIAQEVAHDFYAYDKVEDVAKDTALVGN